MIGSELPKGWKEVKLSDLAEISIADISPTLVWEHLSKAGSRLTKEFNPSALQDTLEKMNLLTGPTERRLVKNVAAMMFCEQPDKFFPRTQVDIVIFPEGRIGNPNNLIEAPAIKQPDVKDAHSEANASRPRETVSWKSL